MTGDQQNKMLQYAEVLSKRNRTARFLDTFWEILFFAVYGTAIMFIADRTAAAFISGKAYMIFPNTAVLIIEGAALLGSLAGAYIITRERFDGLATDKQMVLASKSADDILGSSDGLSSAVDLASRGEGGPIAELAAERAEKLSGSTPMSRVAPMPRIGYRWAVVAGYLAIVWILFFTGIAHQEGSVAMIAPPQDTVAADKELARKLGMPPDMVLMPVQIPELFGEPDRADGKRVPKYVDPIISDGPKRIKEVDGFDGQDETDPAGQPSTAAQMKVKYARIAENLMATEKFSATDMEMLKTYFDLIKR